MSIILLGSTGTAEAHSPSKQDCAQYAQINEDSRNTIDLRRYRKCLRWRDAHRRTHICTESVIGLPATIVKGRPATRSQRRNIRRTLQVGYQMNMTIKELISSVMAITAESNAYNLRYGHSSSVGILQLLDIHGTYRWRMKVENSVGWYFRGVRQMNTRSMTPGQIADAQQRPARRGGYARWQPESTRTVKRFLGPMIICRKSA